MGWAKCARPPTSAATTRSSRAAISRGPRSCRAPRARPTGCSSRAAARSCASARGISRSRSSPARSPRHIAAGNAVVAKPAEQTPLVAHRAVQPAARGGHPGRCDQPRARPRRGGGRGAGADPRTAGVAFTGSTETARAINRALAARDGPLVPFIAETGGLNAMFVDSSALAEQVVSDVIASSFNSAGQRCSALRILCLQKEIAPRVIEILAGAIAELVLGDPARLATDVGPVIDARGARDAGSARGEDGPRGEAALQGAAAAGPRRTFLRAARLRDREPRRHRPRGLRPDPARGALRRRRPGGDGRRGEREGLRPHHGHPQPHRGDRRARCASAPAPATST